MLYQLFKDKRENKLEVRPLKKSFQNYAPRIGPEVLIFNEFYCFSSDRKALKQFAEELKNEWLREAEETLERIKAITI